MSRSLHISCDKCKQPMPAVGTPHALAFVSGDDGESLRFRTRAESPTWSIDLCGSCAVKLREWLEAP